MDVWAYLRGLARWWWLLLLFPVASFLLAQFILVPPAKWDVSWGSVVVFEGNPQFTDGAQYTDFVVLDDMGHLLESDVLGDRVYANLPESVTGEYTREQVGEMFSAFRHARFVEITVSADDPDIARTVAETTERILPEAINNYLLPADFPRIPGDVETLNAMTEPKLQTQDRLIKVGGITLAGVFLGLGAVGIAEWLRLDYRAKYGAR
jgi:hypothetical protein